VFTATFDTANPETDLVRSVAIIAV
jgi:hypothetical protein